MHIVLLVLGLLGGGVFWWYRLMFLGRAASDIADEAGRIRGHFRRRKIRMQAENSPLTAINDPVHAAATIILAIISEDEMIDDRHTGAVRKVLLKVTNCLQVDEAVIYARWACDQIGDTVTVIEKTTLFINQRLSEVEKCELLDMLEETAAAVPPTQHYKQRVRKLRQRLGFQVN